VLEDIDSPALKTDKVMSPSDLILACKILSTHSLKEMLATKGDELDEKYYKHMLLDGSVYDEEMKKFGKYISYHDCAPTLWDKKSKGGNGRGIPSVLACVSSLVRAGMPYEQIWTMPETEAVWLYVANAIAAGSDIDVLNEDDKIAMEMLKNMDITKK